eukprot:COSAG02_NODE_66238_length_256_cov_0.617834_1_plen_42_part_10
MKAGSAIHARTAPRRGVTDPSLLGEVRADTTLRPDGLSNAEG